MSNIINYKIEAIDPINSFTLYNTLQYLNLSKKKSQSKNLFVMQNLFLLSFIKLMLVGFNI